MKISPVARVSPDTSGLYRRFPSGRAFERSETSESSRGLRVGNLRHSTARRSRSSSGARTFLSAAPSEGTSTSDQSKALVWFRPPADRNVRAPTRPAKSSPAATIPADPVPTCREKPAPRGRMCRAAGECSCIVLSQRGPALVQGRSLCVSLVAAFESGEDSVVSVSV